MSERGTPPLNGLQQERLDLSFLQVSILDAFAPNFSAKGSGPSLGKHRLQTSDMQGHRLCRGEDVWMGLQKGTKPCSPAQSLGQLEPPANHT